jgi:hypothetical protein
MFALWTLHNPREDLPVLMHCTMPCFLIITTNFNSVQNSRMFGDFPERSLLIITFLHGFRSFGSLLHWSFTYLPEAMGVDMAEGGLELVGVFCCVLTCCFFMKFSTISAYADTSVCIRTHA